MKVIMSYFINMIPYILITTIIYLIIRIIYLKNKKINIKKELLLLLLIIYISGLLSQTIIPKEGTIKGFNIIPFKIISDSIIEYNKGNIYYFIISLLGNICIFIPFGIIIPLIYKIKDKKIILIGFLTSFTIEFIQIFQNRYVDIDDLLLNTLGTYIGLLIYKLIKKILTISK